MHTPSSLCYSIPDKKNFIRDIRLKINVAKALFSLLLLVLSGDHISAQDTLRCRKIADAIFKNTGEIYFSFPIQSKEELQILTRIISIDHYSGDYDKRKEVHAYANKKQFYNFLKLGYRYTVLPSPGSQINPVMLDEKELKQYLRSSSSFTAYPTYAAYEKVMSDFAAQYPNICQLVNIKTLASGHKLLLLKISDNVNKKEDEPQFLYTSTMHGDEVTGYPMMLSLIEYLLTNYNKSARVTNIVNNIELWINPLANPDGAYKAGNTSVKGSTRANANNVDLNRNYPDPKGGSHPDGEAYQPETKAFMAFADTMNFVMAANFHGGAEVFNYVWDTWAKAAPDKDWWLQQGIMYADSAQAKNSSYMDDLYSGNNPGVTQGYPWYEVEGGRQDYMNYFKHCREATIELSSVKVLAESELDKHWKYNQISLLNYLEASLDGIRGIVTDECSGKPLLAKVFISGHDADSSHVYSALPVGNYHRPIYQGTYNVTYSASGYESKTINGIKVTAGNVTVQHVALKSKNPSKPIITQDNNTLYSSAASGNQWYLDGVAIAGATDTKYIPLKGGAYTVVASVCGAASDPFQVVINGVDEYTAEEVMIYPNPNNGTFFIAGQGKKIDHIQIYDVLGKLICQKETTGINASTQIDLRELQEGVYSLRFFSNGSYATARLFLKK
jgi:hypothetical protein